MGNLSYVLFAQTHLQFQILSLNTLFNTNAITTGGSYWIQFIVLAFVGIVLYAVGMRVFIEKDLPL